MYKNPLMTLHRGDISGPTSEKSKITKIFHTELSNNASDEFGAVITSNAEDGRTRSAGNVCKTLQYKVLSKLTERFSRDTKGDVKTLFFDGIETRKISCCTIFI
jgi:hypothetical protein